MAHRIKSLWKIEWVDGPVLLDIGEWMDAEPELPIDAQVSEYTPMGAEWGYVDGLAGRRRKLSWTRWSDRNGSLARIEAIARPQATPLGQTGTLRVSIQLPDDELAVIDFQEAAVLAAVPRSQPHSDRDWTVWAYRATAGKAVPVSGVPYIQGLPWEWCGTAWEDLTPTWDNF